MSKNLILDVASALAPLLHPARYKGAHGGRGSGKSHFFAELAVEDALRWPGDNGGVGIRFACIREVQKSLKESAKRLIEDKIEKYDLTSQGFKVYREVIETPKDGLISFTGMQDHTADSVKSMEGYDRAWVEEAQSLSDRSLMLLRPTIRKEGSELWFSWNPNRPTDPVDQMLRGPQCPDNATVVQCNWSHNPWFPSVLEEERREAEKNDPDRYGHIWEGEYARVYAGAYFASHLEAAERESRVGVVAADPMLPMRAYWDIGGTSRKSDATSIWVVQFVGNQVRVLDYYEASGQEFSEHVGWLRSQGYDRVEQILPHDGAKHDTVNRVTPQSFLRDAGFKVRVMDNIGTGAAMKRVQAVRRLFPAIWFNKATTEGGREALAWYHAKLDEVRGIDLGPEHDWSSHGADAFGSMAIDFYERSDPVNTKRPRLRRAMKGIA
jgi:phage terminase large subunit